MSLETLLEAARYVEQQELKNARAASITPIERSHLITYQQPIQHHHVPQFHIQQLPPIQQQQQQIHQQQQVQHQQPQQLQQQHHHQQQQQQTIQTQQHQHQQQQPHHNAVIHEPRVGPKIKRNPAEPEDLFCEEKMLIIDEEDPVENKRANGNHPTVLKTTSVVTSQTVLGTTPPSSLNTNTGHLNVINSTHLHINNHEIVQNHYLENHNAINVNHNPSPGSIAAESESSQDSKKSRNGSGTREVHNKLEKNRRAHLKECFELLKKQLPAQDEKKSSNLSILHAAIKHIQTLKKKERELEYEMEKLAREKIASQQKIVALKKDLSATWDHIDFSTILPEQHSPLEINTSKNVIESMDVDVSSNLIRGGTRYSSTSSLSSAANSNSPQTLQHQTPIISPGNSNIHTQIATAAVVCQTQGLNLAQNSRDSPPAISSPGGSIASISTSIQEKSTPSPTIINHSTQQTQQVNNHDSNQQQSPSQQSQQPVQQQTSTTLPTHVLSTCQALATIMPTLQHLGPGLRVMTGQGDSRPLLLTHAAPGTDARGPLIAVQPNGTSEHNRQPLTLVVHSTTANDNRVTLVHPGNLTTGGTDNRPLTLAVQSPGSDVRPVTFVHSGNSEARPIVLATHSGQTINVSTAPTRLRTVEAIQTSHKMVSGMTLVGSNGSELARLPGGAELNILSNGVYRSVKGQQITVHNTVPAGLALSHASVSLQPANGKPGSTVVQAVPATESLTHIVNPHTPISGLTSVATPMTVVSQGNSVILAPAGKMITTPILKPVGQMPQIVNAQYLNAAALMKPVVVVSNSPTNTSVTTHHQSTPVVTSASQASGV